MSEKKIIVTFEADTGEGYNHEVQGMQGADCLAATLELEKNLGGQVTERKEKTELAQVVSVGSGTVKAGQ